MGIAMDGFDIFAHQLIDGSALSDSEICHGHKAGNLGYHYLAGAAGSHAISG